MTQEDINKKSRDLLISNHQSWLQSPVTQVTQQLLDKRIQNCVDAIADKSLNKDLPDSFIRHYAAQLRILKTLKQDLYDSEHFIAQAQQ